jgi:hypothetical protein
MKVNIMRQSSLILLFLLTLKFPAIAQNVSSGSNSGDPFVYTEWQTYTKESTNGKLINDHIFFLEADGDSLWIGTEGGLWLRIPRQENYG